MQHVINLAFDFDDDKVRSIAEQKVLSDMEGIIKEIVLDQIAPYGIKGYYGDRERQWGNFQEKASQVMITLLEDRRDEIVELAAAKLADSIRRTKAWKEKYGEVIQNE